MSATFEILKPVEGVTYTGKWLDQFSMKEITKAIENEDTYVLDGPKDEADDTGYHWSDSGQYEIFDLYYFQYGLDRSEKRIMNKLEYLSTLSTKGIKNKNIPYQIIPVESVAYAQGWFVSCRFLNRKNPTYVATTKDDMIRFFRKYGKIPKFNSVIEYSPGGYINKRMNDTRLVETINTFEAAFKPGYIFVASY